MPETTLIPIERVETRILTLRGRKVLIDRDLADLYGVSTKRLNEAVRRNSARFPDDFLFQLDENEKNELVANCDRFNSLKHSTNPPNAFTEHGAYMAGAILNSAQAVAVRIYVVRAFVKLREIVFTTRELEAKMNEHDRRVTGHDEQIKTLVTTIRQLMQPPASEKKGKMGF